MWDGPPRSSKPAQVFSLLVFALAISGYLLLGWSLYLLHTTPTAPTACAHATAHTSAASLQDEVFVGVTADIERPAYRTSIVVDSNTAICVARASDGAIITHYPLGENATLLGLAQSGGVLYYLLETNPNTNLNSLHPTSQTSLCAMRASSGTRLWCHTISNDYTTKQIVINNGVLYLVTQTQGEATLLAVRASDGAQLWNHQVWLAQFAINNNTVYLLASETQVCAARASDGAIQWCTTPGLQARALAADNAGVYLLSSASSLLALRPGDGSLQWQHSFPSTSSLPFSPAYPPLLIAQDGVLYSAVYDTSVSSQGVLAALQTSDGMVLWETGARLPLEAAVENGSIYLVSEGGAFQALEAANGAPIWQESAQASPLYRLMQGGSRLYLLDSQGGVHAYNTSDGRPLWSQTDCASSSTTPLPSASGALAWCQWGTDSAGAATGVGWSTRVSTNGGLYTPGLLATGA